MGIKTGLLLDPQLLQHIHIRNNSQPKVLMGSGSLYGKKKDSVHWLIYCNKIVSENSK